MKIDRDSLTDCFEMITGGEIRPHNPRLVYNSTSGEFSIQSDLNPMDDDEHIISGQLDTSDGLSGFLGDTSPDECAELVKSMADEYIITYIIGPIVMIEE